MCGILGTFPRQTIRVDFLRHRGPDGEGVLELPEIAMGHARLAILDLEERAAQPKWSSDGAVLLNYNGEIYNYKRLGVGEEFSDTVALVEWLARHGPNFDPAALDGMYAFAAWFPGPRQLVLARDPVGIKPLYLALAPDGSALAFASEIKGFFGVEWFAPRPNRDAIHQREFLEHGRIFSREAPLAFRGYRGVVPLVPTLLEGVFQVCPGQVLTLGLDEPPRSRFTALPERSGDVAEALAQSVGEQSMADVEVGVQLSGGIDSSLVAWEFAQTHPRVHAFHVAVDFPRHNEEKWAHVAADRIAACCDLQFHTVPVTPEQVRRVLPEMLWHHDEPPVLHRSNVYTYLLAECARRTTAVKVLLAGEGADDLFGGYDWHDGKTARHFDRTRRIFDRGGSDSARRLFGTPAGKKDVLRCQLAFDRAFYLPILLSRQDNMSMAHSIETRVPFLSNRFLSMPTPPTPGKVELKARAAAIFGRRFANRPKQGSPIPRRWFAWLPIQHEHLDWLVEPWAPQTKNQSWALAALSAWAALYLHDGWKSRTTVPPENVIPAL